MSAGGPVGEASVTLKMGQDGVVDVKETFGLGDPDGHRGERLRDREDVTTDIGDPMMFDWRPAPDVNVDTLDSQVPFTDGLDRCHEVGRSRRICDHDLSMACVATSYR